MKITPALLVVGSLVYPVGAALAQSGTIAAPPATAAAAPTREQIQSVVDKVKPSLVRIHVVEGVPENGRETKQESFGSGVIISPDGYVVTNHHVAGNARWLMVTLSSKEEVEARLIGTDPLADIAVIKLAPSPSGKPYPAQTWGDSSKLRVGDAVLAMGSPLAFSQSVTSGIVSNTELILPSSFGEGMTLDGEDVGSIVRWIGHDAAIFPGNSGGPLVSLSGEVVGINEIGVGLAGAIPGNIASAVAAEIIAHGHVTRAFTGLDLQPRLRGDRSASAGILVGGVIANSPAAKAGVKTGDLLVRAGAVDLSARFPEELPLVNLEVSRLPVGLPATLEVMRDGKPLTLTLTPTARDAAEARSIEIKGMGLTASDVTPTAARESRAANGIQGASVTSLATGAPASDAQPPLKEGDVILQVGGRKISNAAALKAAADSLAKSEAGAPTLVEVQRDGQRLITVVNIHKQSVEDTSVEVAKAWLPVEVQVVTAPLVTALGLPPGTKGVRVTQLFTETSPATAAKFKIGDVITKLDGLPIDASQPEETTVWAQMVRQYKIGTEAKVQGFRDGKPLIFTVATIRAPKQERELARYANDTFGVTVRSVSYKDRANRDAAPGETGALVVEISKGGWAALAGLRPGDIIRSINGDPITSMETASAKLKALDSERPRSVTFFVSRGVHTQYVQVQTDYSLTTPPPANGTAAKTN